jgi:hypothetical protein
MGGAIFPFMYFFGISDVPGVPASVDKCDVINVPASGSKFCEGLRYATRRKIPF